MIYPSYYSPRYAFDDFRIVQHIWAVFPSASSLTKVENRQFFIIPDTSFSYRLIKGSVCQMYPAQNGSSPSALGHLLRDTCQLPAHPKTAGASVPSPVHPRSPVFRWLSVSDWTPMSAPRQSRSKLSKVTLLVIPRFFHFKIVWQTEDFAKQNISQ